MSRKPRAMINAQQIPTWEKNVRLVVKEENNNS